MQKVTPRRTFLSKKVFAIALILAIAVPATPAFAAVDTIQLSPIADQSGETFYALPGVIRYTISATGDAIAGEVTWSTTGLPEGVQTTFSPAVSSGTGLWATTLSLTPPALLAPGTYPFTVIGTPDGTGPSSNAAASLVVSPKPFRVNSISIESKIYDGTQSAIVIGALRGLVGNDELIPVGVFSDKQVGAGKPVTITLSGADAFKYRVDGYETPLTADITKKSLVVNAAGVNKAFDGDTSATVIFSDDRVAGDQIDISGNAVFEDSTISSGKLVSVAEITLGGVDGGNYNPNTTATTTADITVAQVTSSGGGGGGGRGRSGGSGGGGSSRNTAVDTAVTGSSSTIANTTGSVLGATTYNFSENLYYGVTGEAVTELQKILIEKGYLAIPAPTGWFGPLTKKAVQEYQGAQGIPTTGFVGVLTRTALNTPK